MYLKQLHITGLRNLATQTLEFSPQINLFWGKNGSGKTSMLESIHILATGKSFRSSHFAEFIHFQQAFCRIRGLVMEKQALGATDSSGLSLGIERYKTGEINFKIGEELGKTLAEYARVLPLQLISADSYRLLEASPQFRRQFMDWGMFHVEHFFYCHWQRYNAALKQRNMALKNGANVSAVRAWDEILIESGEAIHQLRLSFFAEFNEIFQDIIADFLDLGLINGLYQKGWSEESLRDSVERTFERDLALRYTTRGPHRADIDWEVNEKPAKIVLSRGQKKLLIAALLIARALWFKTRAQRPCLLLVDDLSTELDEGASQRLLSGLTSLNSQIFLAAVEGSTCFQGLEALPGGLKAQDFKMFHVEHGQLREQIYESIC